LQLKSCVIQFLYITLHQVKSQDYEICTHHTWLTATMQEREHTQKELDKLNACRDFLKQNGVFDLDSFIDLFEEG